MGVGDENDASRRDRVAGTELHRTRFGAYFPRVFAFAHSLTIDETTAKDAAVEAFSRAFAPRGDLTEEEFIVLLFAGVRDHCRRILPPRQHPDDLNSSERELLALVFDARLNRAVIRKLMQTTEQAILTTLIGALRKVRGGAPSPTADRSLRMA